jgi:ketosteroid isomerase-like protein
MTTKSWLVWALVLVTPAASPAGGPDEDVAKTLERQTQELLEAITSGSPAVWARLLDPGVSFTTEDGDLKSKRDMVGDIRPLPQSISGKITVTKFKATVHGDVAVATHVDDEHETFHGHALHCQYRTTDTWKKTPAGWRLIASQVLALRTDPAAITLTPAQMDELVGSYALAPELRYEIRRNGNVLTGQEQGRRLDTLRAEARDVLFVPGRPRYRKVFRRGRDGQVVDFAERREAWDLVWAKAK